MSDYYSHHDNENAMMPGLEDDGSGFFDFNAASLDEAVDDGFGVVPSNTVYNGIHDNSSYYEESSNTFADNTFRGSTLNAVSGDIHNNMAGQGYTMTLEDAHHVLPLTASEYEAILALRAAKHPHINNYEVGNSASLIASSSNNFPFGQGNQREPLYNYDGSPYYSPANCNNGNMHRAHITPPSISSGIGTFDQSQIQMPAVASGALQPAVASDASQLGIFELDSASRSGLDSSPNIIVNPMEEAVEHTLDNTRSNTPTHTEEVNQPAKEWSIGAKCTWPRCSSNTHFKTRGAFNKHFRNIHTHPLLCTVVGCKHNVPFGRQSDLRRHNDSKHSTERNFVCSVPSCDALIKEFARKDHLTKHMKERHDNYLCPLNHCPRSTKESFANAEDVMEHMNTDHGEYECRVGDCDQGPQSKFSDDLLLRHLRADHGVEYWYALYAKSRCDRRIKGTVGSKYFIQTDLNRSRYHNCKKCEKQSAQG